MRWEGPGLMSLEKDVKQELRSPGELRCQSTDGIGSAGSATGVSETQRTKESLMGQQKAQLERWREQLI